MVGLGLGAMMGQGLRRLTGGVAVFRRVVFWGHTWQVVEPSRLLG